MNVSSACPQCGTIANPTDKFCNTCGTPLQRAAPQGGASPQAPAPAMQQAGGYAPPPQQYAPPPGPQFTNTPYPGTPAPPQGAPQQGAPQGQYGAGPGAPAPGQPPQQYGGGARPARCQMGHEIAPGTSYCPQGHPIALDAMQFAGDPNAPNPYAQQPGGYAQPQPQPGFGFGPTAPGGAQGYAPPGAPQYAPPQPAPMQHFGSPQQQYAPPPQGQQPVFQPAAVPPGGYAPPPPQQSPAAVTADAANLNALPPGAKMLRGFLVSFQTTPAGDFWPLHTGRTTVGRANAGEPADIPLADATISSRHAALQIDGNAIVVEDTNSTNGTYVNEEHIGMNGRRELRDGDRLRFGGFTTIVKILGRLG